MPLLQRQQLVIDLRTNVKEGDKNYPTAVQLVNTATSMRDWREPDLMEVKNVAGHEITIDRTKIAADGSAKVYPWQFVAAARFLEAANEDEAEAAFKVHIRKATSGESEKSLTTSDVVSIVKANSITEDGLARAIAKALKEAGVGIAKAASVLLMLALLCLGRTARAQLTGPSYLTGPTSQGYNLLLINTGSNWWSGTLAFTNPITLVSNFSTNANWVVINGQSTNEYYYSSNTTVIVPGVISLANYDKADVSFGYQAQSAGPGTGVATFDTSADGISWQLNAFQLPVATNSIANVGGVSYMASTNLSLGPGFGPAYIRLNNVAFSAGGWATNVFIEVGKKASITGP